MSSARLTIDEEDELAAIEAAEAAAASKLITNGQPDTGRGEDVGPVVRAAADQEVAFQKAMSTARAGIRGLSVGFPRARLNQASIDAVGAFLDAQVSVLTEDLIKMINGNVGEAPDEFSFDTPVVAPKRQTASQGASKAPVARAQPAPAGEVPTRDHLGRPLNGKKPILIVPERVFGVKSALLPDTSKNDPDPRSRDGMQEPDWLDEKE